MWYVGPCRIYADQGKLPQHASFIPFGNSRERHVYYGLWLSIVGKTAFQMFLVNSLAFKGNRHAFALHYSHFKCQNWPLLIQGRLRHHSWNKSHSRKCTKWVARLTPITHFKTERDPSQVVLTFEWIALVSLLSKGFREVVGLLRHLDLLTGQTT